jgi:hypothetical protein
VSSNKALYTGAAYHVEDFVVDVSQFLLFHTQERGKEEHHSTVPQVTKHDGEEKRKRHDGEHRRIHLWRKHTYPFGFRCG